jgi:hypothetical protein
MTNREFYSAIAAIESVPADLRAFAEDAIAKLDKRNDKRRNTPTKAQVANEGVKSEILSAIEDGAHLASDIAAVVGVSTQKVSALCRQMVEGGQVSVSTIKVKGKGEVKYYTIAEGSQYLDKEVEG